MQKKDFFIISVLLLFTAQVALGQNNRALKLDSFLNTLVHYGQFNGNALIAEQGKIVLQRSMGWADFKNAKPNTPNAAFTLASISKVFTATAVLQLRDEGKLKLDDPVNKYLKDFPFDGMTLRNLLSHTSGLPDYELYDQALKNDSTKVFTNRDIIPSLLAWKTPLPFKSGDKWKYANTNYCLLAMVVEHCSGLRFQDYVKQHIFKKAGMDESYFVGEAPKGLAENRTINHDYPDFFTSEPQNVEGMKKFRWRLYQLNGFIGQGNVISTSGDLLKFDQALAAGKLLKATTMAEAFTPTLLNNGKPANADIGIGKASFGLGWFIFEDNTHGKIVFHTGGMPGAVTIFLRNIDKQQTVVLLDNAFSGGLYKNGVNALHILNGETPIMVRQSPVRVFAKVLLENDPDAAFVKLLELKADSLHFRLVEDDLNDLGLRLLYEAKFIGHTQLALEVLRLNILLFPAGFNPYDSYGEALAVVGKKKEAIAMYRRSIAINPANKPGIAALEMLLK